MLRQRGRVGLMAAALVGLMVGGVQAQQTSCRPGETGPTTECSASILVFPRVIANGTRDTIIQITNTGNSMVHAHCFYVNGAPTFPDFPPCPDPSDPLCFNPPLWTEIDFDIWLKGGTRFDVGPGALDVYAGVPFGLTVGVIPSGDDRDAYAGYNLGILVGAQYWFDRFGIFTDLGYRFHKLIDRSDDSGNRFSYRISQLAWHIGGSVAF